MNTEIGDVGRNLRLLIGYSPSITQVCREIQISRQQFSKYLSGRSAPRLRSIQRICDYFGLEEWELILPHPEFRKLIAIRPPENISNYRSYEGGFISESSGEITICKKLSSVFRLLLQSFHNQTKGKYDPAKLGVPV